MIQCSLCIYQTPFEENYPRPSICDDVSTAKSSNHQCCLERQKRTHFQRHHHRIFSETANGLRALNIASLPCTQRTRTSSPTPSVAEKAGRPNAEVCVSGGLAALSPFLPTRFISLFYTFHGSHTCSHGRGR